MNTSKKIAVLQRLLDQVSHIRTRDSDDPTFKTWKNTVERALNRIFGSDSPEMSHFKKLNFFYRAFVMSLGADYSRQHRECFERDFSILTSSIRNYIEELSQELEETAADDPGVADNQIKKIFISHASDDVSFVEELIDLLEIIGLSHNQIFCSSFAGYGIDLGENFLDALKAELSSNTLVLFVLTRNFYLSPISLCEMGAAWVLAKDHIPILVPPFTFSDVKGVIPLTQGFMLNDSLKLNLFKDKIESALGIQSTPSQSTWERKRDRVVERINQKISAPT